MSKKLKALSSKIIYYLGLPVVYIAFKNSTRAYVLLESSGQILFVKSWFGNQKYKLPGGGIKKHETPCEGAVRELYEETGIKLEHADLTEIMNDNQKYHGASYRQIIFSAKLDKQAWPSVQKFEIMEAVWLSPSQINHPEFSPLTINAVKSVGFEP